MKIGLQISTFDWTGSPVKLAPGAMSADEVVEVCHELAELGVQQVIYNTPDAHDLRSIERIASEIIPRVRAF